MSIYQTINHLQDISNLQFEIDLELMENGGELTPELEAKQTSIDGLIEQIIKQGADEIISSLSYLAGDLETLKDMKSNIEAAIKSKTNLIDRVKFSSGALLAKENIGKLKGNLGSLSVNDKIVLDVFDKDLIEDDCKFVLLKFHKDEYLENEFELAEVLKEVSKKEEVNETKLKQKCGSTTPGAKVQSKKTIRMYKKRTKKESE